MTERSKPTSPFVVTHDDAPIDARLTGAVAAIGNFDGVHRGHRAVIEAALARAATIGTAAIAVTFEPHPRNVLRPADPVFRLTGESEKLRLLAATGLSGALVLTFDAAFAAQTAEEFVTRVLVGRLGIRGATIGFDFHFGHQRGGSPTFLAEQGHRYGFSVDTAPPLEDEGRPVSSSSIRAALTEGRVVEAAELLGYPWFASGTVIKGDQRGRTLGFPTANIALDPHCGLKHGIYAVRIGIGGVMRDGVASFGTRPTFDNGAPLLEVHVFDFTGDLYGTPIDVAFIGWIRPELKFDHVDALVRRMDEDARLARGALARAPRAFPALGKIFD
ncbi:MAG: riboflavin kinase / adenylyltransferase [Hyphomicrobiales bacterium]|jgi:riboflavin kinase/FMN adenylyltransferase